MNSTDAMASTVLVSLTESEADRLSELEQVVAAGIATFKEVGDALASIRDERLYRRTHGTFADYCCERWDLGRSRAYQLIDAAHVVGAVAAVSTNVGTPPIENEAQARAITPVLREHGPEVAAQILVEAAESNGGKPTASAITRTARKLAPVPAREPKPAAPKGNPGTKDRGAQKRRKGAEPTDEELAAAVALLGEFVYGIATDRVTPRAAARVIVNALRDERKVLDLFVAEVNAYAGQVHR